MPRTDMDQLGNILGVWAHPDDEAFLTAGVMAHAVDAGRRVVCVTATKGERGFPEPDPRSLEERAALRGRELAECLAVIGVREHRWLGFADGGCGDVEVSAPVAMLTDLISDVQPDTVITFGPDGMTRHVDHIAVSRWTTAAFRHAAPSSARLLYATKTPEWGARFRAAMDPSLVMMEDVPLPSVAFDDLAVSVVLEGAALDRKVAALRCQASQIDSQYEMLGDAAFRDLLREEFFRDATPADWADVA